VGKVRLQLVLSKEQQTELKWVMFHHRGHDMRRQALKEFFNRQDVLEQLESREIHPDAMVMFCMTAVGDIMERNINKATKGGDKMSTSK